MEQAGYVVHFDGLSIPQEDVYTHGQAFSYEQDFYNLQFEMASNHEDNFKKFLNKEENILKDGFRAWCENEYLDGSDIFKNGSFNCSFDASSYSRTNLQAYGADFSEAASRYNQSLAVKSNNDNEDNCYDLFEHAASTLRHDNEEYWCRIDPSVFVLTDMDYLRAKCRWHFRNISDFESNPKIIEHMRYLELFTQCFSVRLLQENAYNSTEDTTTCFNFQNDICTSQDAVYTDHSVSCRKPLECVPEKDNNWKSANKGDNNMLYHPNAHTSRSEYKQSSTDLNLEKFYSRNVYNNNYCKDTFEGVLDSIKSPTSPKDKKRKLSENTIHSYILSTDKNCAKKVVRSLQKNESEIKKTSIRDEDCELIRKDSGLRSTTNKLKNTLKFEMKVMETNENILDGNDGMNINSISSKYAKGKTDDSSTVSSLTTDSEKQKLQLKSVRYKAPAKYENSTESESNSVKEMNKHPVNRFHKRMFMADSKNVKGESIFSDRSDILESASSNDETRVSIASGLLDQFIKNSKKKSKSKFNKTEEIPESPSASVLTESPSTFILDSILRKKVENDGKVKEQPILIIGLTCAEDQEQQQNESEDSKADARIRRYIEGDNLCQPGRYVLSAPKNVLQELELDDSQLSIICKKYQSTTDNQLEFEQFKQHIPPWSQLREEMETVSFVSSDMADQSLMASPNRSTSSYVSSTHSEKSYSKVIKKKSKKDSCKNCKRGDTDALVVDKNHLQYTKKSNSTNVYVSCWKRFCTIL